MFTGGWLLALMHSALGITACDSHWLYFRFDSELAKFGVSASLAELLAGVPPGACALVDIPIGLRARGRQERGCDLAVRELLGKRAIDAAPVRPVLRAPDYAAASAQNERLTGRKLSRRNWQRLPWIAELDGLLLADEALRRWLREAHPEVLFAALAGAPMSSSRESRDGFTERMTILQILNADAERLIASAFLAHGGFEATRANVVDAFVLALCARRPTQLRGLPPEPEKDPKGLPMQSMYLPGPGHRPQ